MARGRRRGQDGLTDEDRELWSQIARGVVPLDGTVRARFSAEASRPRPADTDAPPRPPAAAAVPPQVALPADFRPGTAAAAPIRRDLPLTPAQRLGEQPLRMDHKTHRQMQRGRLRPDARIDLHGMTLAVAKAALTGFVLDARARGLRLVLVITGKGSRGEHGPLPTRAGALRHEVPHWLHMLPLAACVLQVTPAHLRHGGEGAYYVYLRRR